MIRAAANSFVVTWICLALVTGCGERPTKPAAGVQSTSVIAPDGLGRAFIWLPRTSDTLGATNSQLYQVWVENMKGKPMPMLVLNAEATDGVAIRWNGTRDLEVCYGPSHIYYFNNYFDYAEQESRQLYRVEIHLRHVQALSECH